MSTIKLDILYAHKDDIGPATEGHFEHLPHMGSSRRKTKRD